MTESIAVVVATLGGSGRVTSAGVVVAAYLLFCGFVLIRHRRRTASGPGAAPSEDVTLVAFASQTGFAEELATDAVRQLRAAGEPAALVSFEGLSRDALAAARRALFVVSTTGEGDAPDSAARFRRDVLATRQQLTGLRYGLLALGDRSYASYCAFGYALDGWLRDQGATPMFDVIDVDDGNQEALVRWQAEVAGLCGTGQAAWATARRFERWQLLERRLLNDGSPGGPAYHLAFAPPGSTCEWQAGDIAEIVPGATGDAVQADDAARREYSIASLPSDGRLELLVRQVRHEDGSLGIGSGWLTDGVPVGGHVWLRVRRNTAFHPPDADRPVLLIGNGTGLAGLRAHIKARAVTGRHRNWLLFGERTRAHDLFHGEEIAGWLDRGVLERCDLAFSRDESCPFYVQHLLLREGEQVRRWVADGAAVYVCGSRAGMAAGVDDALTALLGTGGLERLREQGRYRRDVY